MFHIICVVFLVLQCNVFYCVLCFDVFYFISSPLYVFPFNEFDLIVLHVVQLMVYSIFDSIYP